MIEVNNGTVKMKGSDEDLLTDYACISKSMIDRFGMDLTIMAIAGGIHFLGDRTVVDMSNLTNLLNNLEDEE